jgi:transcriptional regulator with XRE-family HTH domain
MEKSDVLIEFGKRVRELRIHNSWSQEELAFKSGFHRTYIGMIERGERNISLKNIYRLADTYSIDVKELFV